MGKIQPLQWLIDIAWQENPKLVIGSMIIYFWHALTRSSMLFPLPRGELQAKAWLYLPLWIPRRAHQEACHEISTTSIELHIREKIDKGLERFPDEGNSMEKSGTISISRDRGFYTKVRGGTNPGGMV